MSPHVSDRLSEYMDGALGVQDVERVRAHLDTCPACLQEYRGLQDVQQLLRGLPAPHPREGFMERTHWRLAREAAAQPARGFTAGRMSSEPSRTRISTSPLKPTCARSGLGMRMPWEFPMRTMRVFTARTSR